MAITKKAAEIMIKESTTAYRDHRLQVSSSGLDIAYLTSDFGLKKMQDIYGLTTITIPLKFASSAAIARIANTRDFPDPIPAMPIASFPSRTFSVSLTCQLHGLQPKI